MARMRQEKSQLEEGLERSEEEKGILEEALLQKEQVVMEYQRRVAELEAINTTV